eukprot:5068618-Amphidinium_carterae.1
MDSSTTNVALGPREPFTSIEAVLRFVDPLPHACRARGKFVEVSCEQCSHRCSVLKVKVRLDHGRPLRLCPGPRTVLKQRDGGHRPGEVTELQGSSDL